MARHVDPLVVLNRAALRAKYGSGGYERVRAALRDLAASDRARGLSSRVLAIDDGRSMRSLDGKAVSDPGDAVAAKEAVDAAAVLSVGRTTPATSWGRPAWSGGCRTSPGRPTRRTSSG